MPIYIATCLNYPQGNPVLQALAHAMNAQLIPWQALIPQHITGATILPLATWDYSEHPSAYRQWLAELENAQVRLINSRLIQEWNLCKSYLAALYAQQLPVTPSLVLPAENTTNWQQIIANTGWENPVIKPLIGQSGKQVQRLNSCHNLIAQYPQGALLQPYIHAPFGEICLLYLQGKHFHTIHRRPAPQEWRANSAYGVSIHPITPHPHWKHTADTLLQALPFTPSYARIDGLITENQEFICNEIELIEPALYLNPEQIEPAAQRLLKNINN